MGGAYAMYDGTESPLTQTFGLGMFKDATSEHLEQLEAFFIDRGAPVFHEVSPMADQSILSLLGERGYRPIELTTVMCRELTETSDETAALSPELNTRVIEPGEHDLWAKTSATAWATEHGRAWRISCSISEASVPNAPVHILTLRN